MIPEESTRGAFAEDTIVVNPWKPLSKRTPFTAPCSPDKSFTHRAVMFAGVAHGRSVIRNPLTGDDCLATRDAIVALGVRFTESRDDAGFCQWIFESPGIDQWRSPDKTLDLGNSGTSARLLCGLFAGASGVQVELTGDDSLRRRPMGRVVQPLRNMGADITGPTNGETLKLTITGNRLYSRKHELNISSAQLKSSLLLAAMSADGETVIELPAGGRNHTETMMRTLGASLESRVYLGRERIVTRGPWRPPAFSCHVPNDPSSVAFFAALAAIHPGLVVSASGVMRNPSRVGFFRALERMGVQARWTEEKTFGNTLGESVGTVTFSREPGSTLHALEVGSDEISAMLDEIPVLAVVCAFANGNSRIRGLAELRVKESDRFSAIMSLLSGAGVAVSAVEDTLEVRGGGAYSAFSFGSDDHRMVMSAAILATRMPGPSRILGVSWIRTSFPLFLEAFQNINSLVR